jgi:uncharacterized membrane protein
MSLTKRISGEKHTRSLVKAIGYRMLSITVDSAVAYFFTQDVAFTAGIVAFVNGYSTILYYFHERLWAHIHWGRKPHK